MKFLFYVSTDRAGSKIREEVEVPDEELEGKTESEITTYVEDIYFNTWVWENIDANFERIEN